jgi:hypothetical protein
MGGPLRHHLDRTEGTERPAPAAEAVPEWTAAKVSAILAAFDTFLHNQARKHGVPVGEVWELIRDEVLDVDEDEDC